MTYILIITTLFYSYFDALLHKWISKQLIHLSPGAPKGSKAYQDLDMLSKRAKGKWHLYGAISRSFVWLGLSVIAFTNCQYWYLLSFNILLIIVLMHEIVISSIEMCVTAEDWGFSKDTDKIVLWFKKRRINIYKIGVGVLLLTITINLVLLWR